MENPSVCRERADAARKDAAAPETTERMRLILTASAERWDEMARLAEEVEAERALRIAATEVKVAQAKAVKAAVAEAIARPMRTLNLTEAMMI